MPRATVKPFFDQGFSKQFRRVQEPAADWPMPVRMLELLGRLDLRGEGREAGDMAAAYSAGRPEPIRNNGEAARPSPAGPRAQRVGRVS
jgi:hypothetical protein